MLDVDEEKYCISSGCGKAFAYPILLAVYELWEPQLTHLYFVWS